MYSEILSIISIILSAIAIIVTIFLFKRNQKTATMPVLVFTHKNSKSLQIQNVGSGPAVVVTIGNKDKKGKWKVLLSSPVAVGGSLDIMQFLDDSSDYACVYTDIKGNFYSSTCIKNINKFYEKNIFPEWKANITDWQRKESFEDARRKF